MFVYELGMPNRISVVADHFIRSAIIDPGVTTFVCLQFASPGSAVTPLVLVCAGVLEIQVVVPAGRVANKGSSALYCLPESSTYSLHVSGTYSSIHFV